MDGLKRHNGNGMIEIRDPEQSVPRCLRKWTHEDMEDAYHYEVAKEKGFFGLAQAILENLRETKND